MFQTCAPIIWLGLGSNLPSPIGQPVDTLARVTFDLARHGLRTIATSPIYVSRPIGSSRRQYYNSVLGLQGSIAPGSLLRLVKSMERAAGRVARPRWSDRPLDIDILDFGGRQFGVARVGTRIPGRLILPHPAIPQRGFVLIPLADVSPHWRHPALGLQVKTLLHRNPSLRRQIIGRIST